LSHLARRALGASELARLSREVGMQARDLGARALELELALGNGAGRRGVLAPRGVAAVAKRVAFGLDRIALGAHLALELDERALVVARQARLPPASAVAVEARIGGCV